MAVKIPEKIIHNILELITKTFYEDVLVYEGLGTMAGTTQDIDTTMNVAITTAGSLGTAQVQTIEFIPNTGGQLWGKYLTIATPSKMFEVWFTKDVRSLSVLENSNGGEYPRIYVCVDENATADEVYAKFSEVVAAENAWTVVYDSGTKIATLTGLETSQYRKSLLYAVWGQNKLDNYIYYDQFRTLLDNRYTGQSERRRLNFQQAYSSDTKSFPTVSIVLPSEEPDMNQAGLEGGTIRQGDGQNSYEQLSMGSATTYNLLVVSDNFNEVQMIYHYLKAILRMGATQFEHRGLQNMKISGRDILVDFPALPIKHYHRTVAMSVQYRDSLPSLSRAVAADGFVLQGQLVDSTVSPTSPFGTLTSPVIKVTGGTTLDIEITDTNTNELGFKVLRGTTPSNMVTIADLPKDSVSYQDMTGDLSVFYYYQVVAYNGDASAVSNIGFGARALIAPDGTVTLNGGDTITAVPSGGVADIQVLNAEDSPVGAVESEGLVRVGGGVTIDFTATIDPNDKSILTLEASDVGGEEYIWYLDCADEDRLPLKEGRTSSRNRVPIWGSWDVTLIVIKDGFRYKLTKQDINSFIGNESQFCILDYVNTNESYAWDFISGTVKLKSNYNQEQYSVQMIRDVNTGFGSAGDTLDVGWDANNLLDVAAIEAWEGDLTKCSVYRIYYHDTSVDSAGQPQLIETSEQNRWLVNKDGDGGVPYFTRKATATSALSYALSTANLLYTTGAASCFFGAIMKNDNVNQNVRFMSTQPSRGVLDTYSSDYLTFPANNLRMSLTPKLGEFVQILGVVYSDMFTWDRDNIGQGFKIRVNDVINNCEERFTSSQTYPLNYGSMDSLTAQIECKNGHRFYTWFCSRGIGQDVWDKLDRSYLRWSNWRFGKNTQYDRANSFEYGALMFSHSTHTVLLQKLVLPSDTIISGAFSFSIWFYVEDTKADVNSAILGGSDNTNDCRIGFSNIVGGDVGFLSMALPTSGTVLLTENMGVQKNTWYHLVVTRDAAGLPKSYLNGVECTYQTQNISNDDYDLGAIGTQGTVNYLDSTALCDIGVWDRELTTQEIIAIYQATPNGVDNEAIAPTPLHFWKFDEYRTRFIKDYGSLNKTLTMRDPYNTSSFDMYSQDFR